MANYGLFSGSSKDPMQTYTGDGMEHLTQGYVTIFKRESDQNGRTRHVLVATIRLAEGQAVKEIPAK